jgi:hypothetical protein
MPKSTLSFTTPEEIAAYDASMENYFNVEIPGKICSWPNVDKYRAFQLFTEYPDVFRSILINHVEILDHVQGKAATTDDSPEIFKQYDDWLAAGKPTK